MRIIDYFKLILSHLLATKVYKDEKTKSWFSIGYIQLLGSHLDNRSNEDRIRQRQTKADR